MGQDHFGNVDSTDMEDVGTAADQVLVLIYRLDEASPTLSSALHRPRQRMGALLFVWCSASAAYSPISSSNGYPLVPLLVVVRYPSQ